MDKRFASILAVIALTFVVVFALTKNSNDKQSNTDNNQAKTSQHTQGLNQKGVTLVEYGDYQCPICQLYHQPLKQISGQFNNEISFQFKNLPLSSIHQNGFAAARAAEAADAQGKYWEMHDILYENQNAWAASTTPLNIFSDYASQLKLNVVKFKQDFASQKVNNLINADISAFEKTGQAMATPTFFLNGKYVDLTKVSDNNRPSVEKFTNLINAEIAKKNSAAKP